MELASQSEMRFEKIDSGETEFKWCIFTKGSRGAVAKIVVNTRATARSEFTLGLPSHASCAHIVAVFVKPTFRGAGLGERLLRLAQETLLENGFGWLTLEAEESTARHGRLVSLYERCGFEVHPKKQSYPIEYNDDESYRKVPMRCNLVEWKQAFMVSENPPSEAISRGPSPAPSPAPDRWWPSKMVFANKAFVEEMKRETLRLLQSCPMHMDVPSALKWVESNAEPGTMEHAFRTASLIRAQGHPDWLELAGFLRHLGRIQEHWSSWQAPFMVQIQTGGRPQDDEEEKMDEDQMDIVDSHETAQAKSGPLPAELTREQVVSVIDPERYVKQGMDESMFNWSPAEFAYLSLSTSHCSSAPRQMAQVLRYCECEMWLNSHEYADLESGGDADLRHLTLQFKSLLREADTAPVLSAEDMLFGEDRFLELVDKYVGDVLVM